MIKLRRLTRRERGIAATTFIVAALGLGYIVVCEPLISHWAEMHKLALKFELRLVELKTLAAHRETIEREYAKVQQAIKERPATEDPMLVLFSEVDGLARSAGLDIANVRPLAKKTEGRFERIGVEVSARGEAHSVIKFLQALQSSEHLLNAETLSLLANRTAPPISVTVSVTKIYQIRAEKTSGY